jgi:transcriptional regulator with XRE-family HTH domain
MNKIVFTARIAKGLTEKQMAGKLNITEDEYKEWEMDIKEMDYEFALQLEEVHHVPADFFITYDLHGIKNCIAALEKQKEIIASSDIQNISVPAHTHISIAKMALDALIARQEQILLLKRINELEWENHALRELYKRIRLK